SHASGPGDGADTQSEVPDEQQHKDGGDDNDDYNDEHDLNDEKDDADDDDKNDSEETESDDDGDDFIHLSLSTYKADDHEEEKADDDDEVSYDQKVSTPPDHEFTKEENQEGDDYVKEGEQEDVEEELYGDLNLNLERRDVEMTDAQNNQDTEDVHVTLTAEPLVVQQQSSSVSSDLVSKYINPSPDIVSVAPMTPSAASTIPQPPVSII
ncbi:hypothetical protein Tco_0062087, partial [Tanacetum coccineum]